MGRSDPAGTAVPDLPMRADSLHEQGDILHPQDPMRVYVQAAVLLLLVSVGHAQNVSGPGTNSSTTSTTSSKSSGPSINPFLTIVVISVFLLLCSATAWADVRRRSRVANANGAPRQPAPERRLEQLKPEPFIPVVVVSPNNEVVIARQVDAPRAGPMQSPFQQTAQGLQSQPSFNRGRVMPLWLETVLSRQRSTASVDDIEAQKGDASSSSRSAALRANSSRLANMMRLGSSLTIRQSSADTALDDQVLSISSRMPEGEQDHGGRNQIERQDGRGCNES
ncbi:g8395 [Coccomyxa elongata]